MYKTILVVTIICIFAILHHQTEQAITYFPPNDKYFFEHTLVDLKRDNHQITWLIESKTNEAAYLRQDVGLMYANGKFVSFYNDWKTGTDSLQFQTSIDLDKQVRIDAVGIHYAEFHEDEHIYSIEEIATTSTSIPGQQAPFRNQDNSSTHSEQFHSFKQAYLQEINSYFSFDHQDYDFILLNELPAYMLNHQANWSVKQKEAVIGHLAESIYKQYITKLLTHQGDFDHRIPAILFGKNEPFILIVFQLDGKWYQYKQQMPLTQIE